jgi:peptide/nickel transport system permease protein
MSSSQAIGSPATGLGSELVTRRQPLTGVRGFFHRLRKTRFTVASMVIIALVILAALFAPVISPYDPAKQQFGDALAGPSPHHLFGADNLGRDVFSRVVYGSRVSLQVGLIAVTIALVIGTTLGLIAGYNGNGKLDTIIMRCMDALLAFPTLVLALAITAALGPRLRNVMIAVGVIGIPGYARLVRGQVLSVSKREYIESARVVGAGTGRILWRHVLPNVTAPIIVQASLGIAFAILAEASLSFLGLGVQPPTPSWGGMLAVGKDWLDRAAWMAIAPGSAIFITVLAFNFLGDGIRDALDPRLRQR